MNRLSVPGGWYCDATPAGAYVVAPYSGELVIRTTHGTIPCLDNERLLYVALADDGVQFAGIGNGGLVKDRALRWDGQRWHDHGLAFGPRAVVFDQQNRLHVIYGPPAVGYRYVDANGRLVTAEETYADPARQIWEYTELGDLTIGQGGEGPHGDDPLIALYRGRRILIQPGRCRFVKFRRAGDQLALAWVQEDTESAALLWLSVADLLTFPDVTATPNPIPNPGPIVPNPGTPTPEPETPVSYPEPPNRKAVVDRVVNANRHLLDGTHDSGRALCRIVVDALRKEDRRWGLNWKRGKVGDQSADVIAYKFDEITRIVDIIAHLDGPPEKRQPIWHLHSVEAAGKVAWFWDGVDHPQPEPLPTPDNPPVSCNCAEKIAALERSIDALTDRLVRLESQPEIDIDAKLAAALENLRVTGSTSREWGHSHRLALRVIR